MLDEADRMLDMGFIHDIKRIVAMLRKERQTLFFSATMPQEITRLADADAARSRPRGGDAAGLDRREGRATRHPHRKGDRSRRCWPRCSRPNRSTACWCSPAPSTAPTKSCAPCRKPGFAAEAIHGNKSQNQRERVLAAFRDGKLRILIATDIAARGIDVDGVSHVVNYDLPNIPESYVHRIGRTARAGADGVAISFCDHEEAPFLRDIERLIRMSIPSTDKRTGERPAHRPAQQNAGDRNGGRPHRNGRQQRGHGGGNGGGNGRHNGNNGHRSQAAATAIKAARSQNGHQAGHAQAPGRKPRQGSQTASEMLHSCSARMSRAATPATAHAYADRETTGWRRKNCWSSTVR